MEIDNHILCLSMEFEKQNIIVTEWETEKAKLKSDRLVHLNESGGGQSCERLLKCGSRFCDFEGKF